MAIAHQDALTQKNGLTMTTNPSAFQASESNPFSVLGEALEAAAESVGDARTDATASAKVAAAKVQSGVSKGAYYTAYGVFSGPAAGGASSIGHSMMVSAGLPLVSSPPIRTLVKVNAAAVDRLHALVGADHDLNHGLGTALDPLAADGLYDGAAPAAATAAQIAVG